MRPFSNTIIQHYFLYKGEKLTIYVGLDVVKKQSRRFVKGKPKISKKENQYLWSALLLPALSTIKWNDNFRDQYAKIVIKNTINIKGCVSVQRKLLERYMSFIKTNSVRERL